MVYGIIQLINFAHGEIVMIGGFAALTVYVYWLPESFQQNVWIALPLMLLFAVVVAVIAAVLMERLAYRPLRNAPRLAPLITAIGVSIFLQEAVRLYYPGGKNPLSFPRLVSNESFSIAGVSVPWVSVFVVVVAVILMVALQMFVRRTRTGKAMRATAQDPDTAKLM